MSPLVRNQVKNAGYMLVSLLFSGCATSYRFVSSPEGAAVYQRNGAQKVLLGETPIEYAKTALPVDGPFVITFEKAGYEARELAVTPTDNSLTTVSVQLEPKEAGGGDEGLKRVRTTLRQIFAIQEQIFQKKYVDALASLKLLEAKEPGLAEVAVLRGSVYVAMGDPGQARREWQKAIALDPSLDDVKQHLAKLPKAEGATP